MTKELNSTQRDELIEQYVDLLVDSMSMRDLVAYVSEDLTNFCEKLTDNELKEEISLTLDDETYDELIDNVTMEKCTTYQELLDSNTNNTGGKF